MSYGGPAAAPAPAVLVIASNGSGQNLTGNNVTVTGWTATTNVGSAFNATTGVFTAPSTKIYTFSVRLYANTTGFSIDSMSLILNRATTNTTVASALANQGRQNLVQSVALTSGQTIEVETFTAAGSPLLSVLAGANDFSVTG